MALIIGTSGWQYRHWRETFYPPGPAQADWLEYYGDRFATVGRVAAPMRHVNLAPAARRVGVNVTRTPQARHVHLG